jgi:hypothetical protein
MNKTVILLFISLAVLIFSIISVSVAPIINDLLGNFTSWGKHNCQYYSDKAKYTKELDVKYKNERTRDLCNRQNAMYGLEYSAFIFDLCLGFLIAQLSLMHYFNAGKSFEKKTGLIGLIGGGIGFIITLIYVCYSGYIFNNDTAYKQLDDTGTLIDRLYSNGAKFKIQNSNQKTIYADDLEDDAQYAKYKDLGGDQYNYNKKLYEAYVRSTDCHLGSTASCEYLYPEPSVDVKNKYLYDRWCLSLVLAVFITVLNAGIIVFGLLLFLNKGDSGEGTPVEIK